MFTGLIETIGLVSMLHQKSEGMVVTIEAPNLRHSIKMGDSIATNGVCLTVDALHDTGFSSNVMPLTLSNTQLGRLRIGSKVNLERAMTLNSRLDGHIVTGHVDAVGTILAIRQDGLAKLIEVEYPSDIGRRLIPNGSIAINGISLTIQVLESSRLVVSIIPHTQGETNLAGLRVGDKVNLETDVIGKYVEKMLSSIGKTTDEHTQKQTITMSFLESNGFI